MSRIDETYFEGGLRLIPNLDRPEVLESLTDAIDKWEPIFFKEFFGYEFQKDMLANPTDPEYAIILDGGEWTDSEDFLQELTAINESIADYVFWNWVIENLVKMSGGGYMFNTNENSTIVQPISNPVRVWNEMVDKMLQVYDYIDTNPSDYDYDKVIPNVVQTNYVNEFGI